mmetsp:Transcript_21772/g.55231  ORF Transcript_21772/g.55231 Transcript_21772/m.55231 type:complete len:214 (+) Transcript_21772:1347-1988(+)
MPRDARTHYRHTLANPIRRRLNRHLRDSRSGARTSRAQNTAAFAVTFAVGRQGVAAIAVGARSSARGGVSDAVALVSASDGGDNTRMHAFREGVLARLAHCAVCLHCHGGGGEGDEGERQRLGVRDDGGKLVALVARVEVGGSGIRSKCGDCDRSALHENLDNARSRGLRAERVRVKLHPLCEQVGRLHVDAPLHALRQHRELPQEPLCSFGR